MMGPFMFILASFLGFVFPVVSAAGPSEISDQIQIVLRAEEAERSKLIESLGHHVDGALRLSLSKENGQFEDEAARSIGIISRAKDDLAENQARIEFLNAFLSGLQRSALTDLRSDSCKILKDLAFKLLASSAEVSAPINKTWLFEIYLCLAIRDVMEPGEKFGDFVKKFMTYSSLTDPQSPTGFLQSRDYVGN